METITHYMRHQGETWIPLSGSWLVDTNKKVLNKKLIEIGVGDSVAAIKTGCGKIYDFVLEGWRGEQPLLENPLEPNGSLKTAKSLYDEKVKPEAAAQGLFASTTTYEDKNAHLKAIKGTDIYSTGIPTSAFSKSDGSTASYYVLPPNSTKLQHLISFRDMNAQIGEIFRSCYRYGIASHSDKLRDAKKILFYAKAEVERLEKEKR